MPEYVLRIDLIVYSTSEAPEFLARVGRGQGGIQDVQMFEWAVYT
jgi:hypothetical protein